MQKLSELQEVAVELLREVSCVRPQHEVAPPRPLAPSWFSLPSFQFGGGTGADPNDRMDHGLLP